VSRVGAAHSSSTGYLPQQPGYNKRLRMLATMIGWLVGVPARDTSLCTDDVWVFDSTDRFCDASGLIPPLRSIFL
jgi:hypothetical protein